jgi:branched-chain amino acid transport system ATP-binding protein
MLSVSGLTVRYGPVTALNDVSLHVDRGEIVALVGANGAGKSTLLRTLSGLVRPAKGVARFGDLTLTKAKPHQIVRAGLVHVPEGRHVFARFSLQDNLVAGAFVTNTRAARARAAQIIEQTPILARRAGSTAGQLSGGEQQILVIQRALMSSPSLVMLDEPSMGLSPKLVDEVLGLIADLSRRGTTVLLVEQNVLGALGIADRVYALGSGDLVFDGTPGELRDDPVLLDQFLGAAAAPEGPAGSAPTPR